jgi:hypothetical protein
MSIFFNLSDIETNEFHKKMCEIDKFIKFQSLLSKNFFLSCLISSLFMGNFIVFLLYISSKFEIINYDNFVFEILFSATILGIFIFPLIVILLMIIAFGDPISVNVIKYKNKEIKLTIEKGQNLTDKITNFNFDNIENLDCLKLVDRIKDKGFFYNYELCIIKNLQKI